MSPLVAKEIRLLRPAFVMALVLAVVPGWLLPGGPNTAEVSRYPFLLGTMMLALSSFGREFGLNTFSLLLAQPMERHRIWRTKVAVLAAAISIASLAWYFSCSRHVYAEVGQFVWHLVFVKDISDMSRFHVGRGIWLGTVEALAFGATAGVVTFAGGLWTTLLLRQIAASFWFTILVPGAILMALVLTGANQSVVLVVLGLYSVAGFWWARRLFLRIQEGAWTGGVIHFPGRRPVEAASQPSLRTPRALAALFWKELQLHQVGLIGMGCLFLFHLAIVAVRKLGHQHFTDTTRTALEMFGGIWLMLPLLVAGPGVAEERNLGTIDGHLCLPVSRRVQFAIKLVVVFVLGGLLAALLPWTAEGIGASIGAGPTVGELKNAFSAYALILLFLGFLGLSLIGFYASTLSRNIVQALATGVVAATAVWVLANLSVRPTNILSGFWLWRGGFWLWRGNLVHYLAWPTLVVSLLWLAWGNFRYQSEHWRVWRRNLLTLAIGLASVTAITSAVYHRAWELVTPLEPPHGPPRLAGPKPTALYSYGGSTLAILLPDGRLWTDSVAFAPGRPVLALEEGFGFLFGGKWTSLGGGHFLAGSNWADAVASYRDTVAVRSDGTLWVSKNPRPLWDFNKGIPPKEEPADLVKFGTDTNWQSVARGGSLSVVLLKQDGSLWRLGTNDTSERVKWSGFLACEPQRLGTDSDWTKVLSALWSGPYAWKRDGQAWMLPAGGLASQRFPGFDHLYWRSLTLWAGHGAGVLEDGTLWIWDSMTTTDTGNTKSYTTALKPTIWQIGHDTDWTAVTSEDDGLVALKADGSLWRGSYGNQVYEPLRLPPNVPVRLGTHKDWVAVGSAMGGIVSLAADGSLWLWQRLDGPNRPWDSDQPLLSASRKPAKIGNIFGPDQ